jgi:hypothetical protein
VLQPTKLPYGRHIEAGVLIAPHLAKVVLNEDFKLHSIGCISAQRFICFCASIIANRRAGGSPKPHQVAVQVSRGVHSEVPPKDAVPGAEAISGGNIS